ncbi:hypothetical protein V5799_025841 [Amblyomma americanum]|uniref:Uncharacterized protein n=1 Tax=Amblyomma americanum TaxID=6943 RepID=A0AAQ4E8D2_AMBAM
MDGEKRPSREPQRNQAEEDSAKESHDEDGPAVDPSKPGPSMIQHIAEPQGDSWAPLVRKRAVEDLTTRKQPAKDRPSSTAPKRIPLQDHIPESLVYDCKTMDNHSLKLTDLPFNVTIEEVQELCKDAVQIQFIHDGSLLRSTARYEMQMNEAKDGPVLMTNTKTTRINELLEALGEDVMDAEKHPSREPQRDQAEKDGAKESHDDGGPAVDLSKPGPSMIQHMAEPEGVSWAPLVRKRAVGDLTARKWLAKDKPRSAAPERIRLQDHIAESFLHDYKTMDKHRLKVTDLPFNVTAEEVREHCKDAGVPGFEPDRSGCVFM